MNMKQLIKKMLNAACVSMGLCTCLSVFFYGTMGRGSVALIQPFTMNLSNLPVEFALALLFYAVLGMACVLIPWVFRNERWSLLQATGISFAVTFVGFYVIAVGTALPWGAPSDAFWSYLSQIDYFIPMVIIVIDYVLIWFGAFLYYRHQTREMTRKLNR